MEYTDVDRIMFPINILEKGISFYYNFKRKKELGENNWEQLVEEWKQEQQGREQYAYKQMR